MPATLTPCNPRHSSMVIVFAVLALAGCHSAGGLNANTAPADFSLSQAVAELEAWPAPAGVDAPVFEQLRHELKRILILRDSGKLASAPPTDAASAAHLTFDGATDELYWAYTTNGDYDQNGEVNISDLTPLGQHFGESGEFDYDDIQAVIDGDSNGEINISDVTESA